VGILRTPDALVHIDADIQELKAILKEKTAPLIIAFIDLAGSTPLKEKHPQETWLPIIARFLSLVSKQVIHSHGNVVKYIGDEIMAVFPNVDNLGAQRAESFVWECEKALSDEGDIYAAKYAIDCGEAARIQDNQEADDFLGTCVDRCARIAKIALPHTAVGTGQFVSMSKNPNSWSDVGEFEVRGLKDPVRILQLRNLGPQIGGKEAGMILAGSRSAIAALVEAEEALLSCKETLALCKQELSRLQTLQGSD